VRTHPNHRLISARTVATAATAATEDDEDDDEDEDDEISVEERDGEREGSIGRRAAAVALVGKASMRNSIMRCGPDGSVVKESRYWKEV
jgi:hypothetical protein